MHFNRQLYKQKPSAWGPASSVRASIFNNAERIGIDPASIALAMPMWGPGDQLDYAKKLVCTNAGAMYTDNSLYFNNDYVNVSTRPALGDGCLIHTSVKQTGYTVQNSGLLDTNRTASAGYSLVFRLDLGYQFSVGINTSIKRSNAGFGLGLNQISWYWKMGVEQKVYNNGKVLSQDNDSSVNNTTQVAPNYDIKIGNYYDLASERGLRGYIEQIIILTGKQNKSLISLFADNPYFLLQRVAPVYYSVPGGGVPPTFNPLFLNAAQPTRVIQ